MTDPKNKKKQPADELEFEIDDLPPLDHDETDESDPEEIASFLEPMDDEDAFIDERSDKHDPQMDPMEIARDLIDDSKNSSFVEEREGRPQIEANIDMEEAGSWTEDEDAPVDDLGDDWFLEDEKRPNSMGDNGEEGPENEKAETFGIDEDTWDNLEENDLDDEMEEPLEAMERLGIEIPFSDETDSQEHSMVLDRQFLGPRSRGATAVAFQGGSPLAAGEGLFVLGADGMLHAAWSANSPSVNANSIYVRGESIFIGTTGMGALVTHDRGRHFRQLNSWFTQGLLRGVQASSEQVSTSFKIWGQDTPFGYRLLGCTGRGQLFSSVDGGKTWRSLAISGQCLSLSAISGTSEIFMVTQSKKGEIGLWWSENTDDWEPRPLPGFWPEQFKLLSPISIEATPGALIIGSADPAGPVAFTFDGGGIWTRVEGAGAATAVALDQDDPMCMAAAAYDSNTDSGTVVYSEDKGLSWQTVLTIESGSIDDQKKEGEAGCAVMDLAVHTGRTREIVAVTKSGVYLITLTRKGVSH